MKFRQSGMPAESVWSAFFGPLTILKNLGLNTNTDLLVDVGCGYGTFALPAAQYIKGKVRGVDIDKDMICTCETKAEQLGIKNATFFVRDVFAEGFGIPPGSADCILLFNILHCEWPINLFVYTYQALNERGSAFVIHWKNDEITPSGPSMNIRPKSSQIIQWAQQTNLRLTKEIEITPYHYGLAFQK